MDQEQRLFQMLDKINDRLTNLENRINSMSEQIKNLENSANNMNSHINFVDEVYRQVRAPFSSLLNWTKLSLPESKPEMMMIDDTNSSKNHEDLENHMS